MGLTGSIDLERRHRNVVIDLLDTYVRHTEVWAYGSRVAWTSHPASDLDLVVFARPDQTYNVWRLRDAFAASNLPFGVDVHIWDHLPSSFHEEITRNHVVLRHEFSRNISHTNREVSIGEFAPFSYGKSLPAAERNRDGSVPVFGSNGIIGWHDRALTGGPTVIIGRKGTAGAVHYSPVPCWPIDTTFLVEGDDADMVRFKYYLLRSLRLHEMNADSAVPGLNRNEAHATKVRIPDPNTQRWIGGALGMLDDRIDLNRRMSKTLEAIAQALFKSWFIDFDPVRAKMEGRDTGLSDHITDLFPDSLVDSRLGLIPEGWDVVRLGDVMELNPQRSVPRGEMATYLEMADMPTETHRPSSVKYRAPGSGVKFMNGDTLVARITPCLENGKIAFVSFLSEDEVGWGSTEYVVLRPRPPLPLAYAYLVARTIKFRDFAVGAMTGSSGRQACVSGCAFRFRISQTDPPCCDGLRIYRRLPDEANQHGD